LVLALCGCGLVRTLYIRILDLIPLKNTTERWYFFIRDLEQSSPASIQLEVTQIERWIKQFEWLMI
jgi:hypothetical protein